MNKKSFYMYTEWKEIFNALTPEQAGNLIKAVFAFQTSEKFDLDPVVSLVFIGIKQQLIRDLKRYTEKVQINRENGKLGGRPKTQNNRSLLKTRLNKSDKKSNNPDGYFNNPNNHDKDKDKDKDKISTTSIWKHYLDKALTKEILTPTRESKIKLRLKTFTPTQIKKAIDNCYSDKFWSKQNCDYLFRSDDNVDKLLNLNTIANPVSAVIEKYKDVDESKLTLEEREKIKDELMEAVI